MGDTFKLEFDPRLSFMTYSYPTNTITFKLAMIGEKDITSYNLRIRLTDNKGAETKYE